MSWFKKYRALAWRWRDLFYCVLLVLVVYLVLVGLWLLVMLVGSG